MGVLFHIAGFSYICTGRKIITRQVKKYWKTEKTAILLILTGAVLRLLAYVLVQYPTDDALITLRYARNLADGLGAVFNPGMRIFGTSAPLFMLLNAGLISIGVEGILSAYLLNWLFFLFTCILLYFFVKEEWGRGTATIALLFFTWNPFFHIFEASGMETPLFHFLFFLLLVLMRKKAEPFNLSLVMLTMVLTRPEAIFYDASAILFLFYQNWKRGMKTLLFLGLFSFLTALLIYGYYGVLLPEPLLAKKDLSDVIWRLKMGAMGSLDTSLLSQYFIHPQGGV